MKFIVILSCVLLAVFIGQAFAEESDKLAEPSRHHHRSPHRRPDKKPCGSNDLGDYKGACDPSVPVIVLPKGRPVMERVLDWFNCGTEMCRPSVPTGTGTVTGTGGTGIGGTSGPGTATFTGTGTGGHTRTGRQ